ncbi:MAG: hypothetical protein QE271_05895 [Bacteriovoracaceae bacterium]|nr:hypothetical protein [Bacteriovoracaceae bacterium]
MRHELRHFISDLVGRYPQVTQRFALSRIWYGITGNIPRVREEIRLMNDPLLESMFEAYNYATPFDEILTNWGDVKAYMSSMIRESGNADEVALNKGRFERKIKILKLLTTRFKVLFGSINDFEFQDSGNGWFSLPMENGVEGSLSFYFGTESVLSERNQIQDLVFKMQDFLNGISEKIKSIDDLLVGNEVLGIKKQKIVKLLIDGNLQIIELQSQLYSLTNSDWLDSANSLKILNDATLGLEPPNASGIGGSYKGILDCSSLTTPW